MKVYIAIPLIFIFTTLSLIYQIKNDIIEEERAKSEKLLLNILPGMVAEELKSKGKAKA